MGLSVFDVLYEILVCTIIFLLKNYRTLLRNGIAPFILAMFLTQIFTMKKTIQFLVGLFAYGMFTLNIPASDGSLSEIDIIDAYIASTESYQRISYDLETTVNLLMGDGVSISKLQAKGNIDFPGKRSKSSHIDIANDKGGTMFENLKTRDSFFFAEIENNEIDSLQSKLHISESDWLDYLNFPLISILFGYVHLSEKSEYIPDLLKKGKMKILELPGKQGIYELTSTTENTEFVLTYSMKPDFIFNGFRYKKTKDIKPLDTYEISFALLTDGSSDKPTQLIKLEKIKEGSKLGIDFPAKVASINAKILRLDTMVNFKDSDFSLSVLPQNGTPVSMQDAPQIQYIWMDGKIVPKTDELMLQIARGGHKFMPGPKEPRFWFMSIGIILILIACGTKAYKHFNRTGVET